MCVFLYITVFVITVTDVGLAKVVDIDNDEYVSLESKELAVLNEIDDSLSFEDNDISYENITQRHYSKNQTDVDLQNTLNLSNLSPLENATSYHFDCEKSKTSSSEENLCRSTLVNYPYSASIQKKGAHYASGALINEQCILTAAGVFYNVRETIKLYKVRLGSVDCKRGGVVLPIKRVDIHPSYKNGKPPFDLALITLAKPVEITDYVKPIRLSRVKEGVVGAKFLTTYWPRLIVNGKVLSGSAKERLKQHNMRVSTQSLIPWKSCAVMMKARNAALDENSLCLRPLAAHHSVCVPDVGAPVVADDGLWGITSGWTSKQCTTYPSPTIVTRTGMPSIRDWLKSVL